MKMYQRYVGKVIVYLVYNPLGGSFSTSTGIGRKPRLHSHLISVIARYAGYSLTGQNYIPVTSKPVVLRFPGKVTAGNKTFSHKACLLRQFEKRVAYVIGNGVYNTNCRYLFIWKSNMSSEKFISWNRTPLDGSEKRSYCTLKRKGTLEALTH